MAPAMAFGLRASATLTKDGRDVLDQEGFRLLSDLISLGPKGAAEKNGLSQEVLGDRLDQMESMAQESLWRGDGPTDLAKALVEEMARRTRLLEDQLENLWRKPTLTCDGLVIRDDSLLLVQRGREPFRGRLALPGGIMEYGERAEDCVVREVEEETGIRTEVVRLVGAFSNPNRDPRGHFVTLLYLLRETGGDLLAGDDAEGAAFVDLDSLPELAFDHDVLVGEGVKAAREHVL